MTFSSFYSCPGVIIWHSKDLVNWVPICAAVSKPLGSVWAMDLAKVDGRYFIYIPAIIDKKQGIYVIYADNIAGPWSDPISLNIDTCIDPGHAIGEDGKRYLFFNGVRRIQLADDGLSTVGKLEKVYEPWKYPENWDVEMFAPEGPKILRRGDWFYMILAVGGTAGPPTSHMVVVARSKSIHGPWEDCPNNPIVHTKSANEKWWSRGHATFIEGPKGDWWAVYHAYENGFRTRGRQTILEPIEWDKKNWPKSSVVNVGSPIKAPISSVVSSPQYNFSDDFTGGKLGIQWAWYKPKSAPSNRMEFSSKSVIVHADGISLGDTSPMLISNGDRSYDAIVDINLEHGGQAGICLFYSERMYCGVGFDGQTMFTYNYGQEHDWFRQSIKAKNLKLRVKNRNDIITFYYALDGGGWVKHPWQMEVSGYHHNVLGDFLSLKVGLFVCGNGAAEFSNFKYYGENGILINY